MQLKGSKTEKNLKDAFAGESQANRRYLYFAAKADVEGYPDVAALFRALWASEQPCIAPSAVKAALGRLAPHFAGYGQQVRCTSPVAILLFLSVS